MRRKVRVCFAPQPPSNDEVASVWRGGLPGRLRDHPAKSDWASELLPRNDGAAALTHIQLSVLRHGDCDSTHLRHQVPPALRRQCPGNLGSADGRRRLPLVQEAVNRIANLFVRNVHDQMVSRLRCSQGLLGLLLPKVDAEHLRSPADRSFQLRKNGRGLRRVRLRSSSRATARLCKYSPPFFAAHDEESIRRPSLLSSSGNPQRRSDSSTLKRPWTATQTAAAAGAPRRSPIFRGRAYGQRAIVSAPPGRCIGPGQVRSVLSLRPGAIRGCVAQECVRGRAAESLGRSCAR